MKSDARRYTRALADGSAATQRPLLEKLSSPFNIFTEHAQRKAAKLAKSKGELDAVMAATNSASFQMADAVPTDTDRRPALAVATLPLRPTAPPQPVTRHVFEHRPDALSSQYPGPLERERIRDNAHLSGWEDGFQAARDPAWVREEESYAATLAATRAHQQRLNDEMDEDLDVIAMLQRGLGEAYYKLERLGAQVTGDLSNIRELAFHPNVREVLRRGEKRELCGRLTPPDFRKFSRGLAKIGEELHELREEIEGEDFEGEELEDDVHE